MKAKLKNYRQSPRKVRLVTDLIKGKGVEKASKELDFVNKRASRTVKKLIDSAISNAKENNSSSKEDLFVKSATVDDGRILYRIRRRARGTAHRIRKRTSNISLILDKKSKTKANSKSETLNSKQVQNSKSQTKTKVKIVEKKSKS